LAGTANYSAFRSVPGLELDELALSEEALVQIEPTAWDSENECSGLDGTPDRTEIGAAERVAAECGSGWNFVSARFSSAEPQKIMRFLSHVLSD
jgi:hypothetical protein